MKKIIRLTGLIAVLLVVVSAGAVAIGIYHPKAYEDLFNQLIFKKTGYRYSTDDISIQISPTKVFIRKLTLTNPAWTKKPEATTIRESGGFLKY